MLLFGALKDDNLGEGVTRDGRLAHERMTVEYIAREHAIEAIR